MADTGTTPTPGASTSEYAVTKITMILTIAATIVGVLTDALQSVSTALPQAKWIGPVLSGLGLVGTVLAALGYQYTRAQVKAAAHSAAGAQPAASAKDAAANVAGS